MIVYLARDIPVFVMYCIYGESGSSLLIDSTDSMMVAPEHSELYIYNYSVKCPVASVNVFIYVHINLDWALDSLCYKN